jgi:hypothetical protein
MIRTSHGSEGLLPFFLTLTHSSRRLTNIAPYNVKEGFILHSFVNWSLNNALQVAFKYFWANCNVFIVCIVVMQISYKSSVRSEDIATSNRWGSEGDGTNCSVFECHQYKALSRRNGAGIYVLDRLLLFISTVTWLYLLMGEIRLFVLWEGHCGRTT